MVFCKACARHVPVNRGEDGFLSCSRCGKVLKFDNFSNDVTFIKNAAGQSLLSGSFVRSVDSENQSRERLYAKAYEDITSIKNGLGMGENMAMVDQAMKYYRIAVERKFTKGRKTEQVQAVCLYIACRENRRPYLLIDFSIFLRINVFVLGAVFLQLCRVLSLTEHPIFQKLHDPSIFIHKYTASLVGRKNRDVSNTAVAIIASMNRDWMQTGRMPGGIWGSALYISALAHGIRCSKTDILRLVHVCEATLMKRLVEFENTESGSLTIEELNAKVEELKKIALAKAESGVEQPIIGELTCEHQGTGIPFFALGLCRDCYANSIGLEGGSDPPAFQRAEEQRMKKLSLSQEANELVSFETESSGHIDERLLPPYTERNGPAARYQPDDTSDTMHGMDDTSNKDLDETDTLAELDEDEVDFYVITDKKEIELKTALWEELNREFLKEQEEKRAAAGAGKKTTDEGAKGQQKEKKRAGEAKGPARTAVESCSRMLIKKRLSSKVNYEALEKLFAEPEASGSKRMRTKMSDEEELTRSDAKVKEPEMNNDDTEEPEDDNYDAEDAGTYYDDEYDKNDDAYGCDEL